MQRVNVSKKEKQQKNSAKSKQSNNPQQQVVDLRLIQRATRAPQTLTPIDVQALQGRYGNQYVQRMLDSKDVVQREGGGGKLPDISGLSETAKALLGGVLEKNTINEAVRKIHANTFTKTGWKYNASISNTSGQSYVDGGQKSGMCESYRNAFGYILGIYDNLRATHPVAAIRDGNLLIEPGNDLSTDRFYTKTGLTLMGASAIKGNIFAEFGGDGTRVNDGIDAVNRFAFKGHWTLKVNGIEYDPIFPGSIDQNNVQSIFTDKYSNGTVRLVPDLSQPISSGEFGATFAMISDYNKFNNVKDALVNFYNTNKNDIDSHAGKGKAKRFFKFVGNKFSKPDLVKNAKALVQTNIADMAGFNELMAIIQRSPEIILTRAEMQAIEKVLRIAGFSF